MADYYNQSIPSVDRRDDVNQQIQRLCLQCRGIRRAFLNIWGGYFHHTHFDEVVAKAEYCLMCRLIRDGLRRNFADKPRKAEGNTALDRHLKTHKNGFFQVRPVMIKPCVVDEGGLAQGKQVGLKIYIIGVVSCLLSCWPESVSYDHDTTSALRPTGVEKLQLARRWFEQSQDAAGKPGSAFLRHEDACASCPPTRLIYLGEPLQYPPQYVRLVCSWSDYEHRAETPRYIALSHRWGSSQHLTTKRSNYVYHLLGIKFSHLPKTFQDAAAVALFLGIRYLWIDALCIIQDDTTDWHREALLMGQVYESAVCTIAIHNARDDSEGFLEKSLLPPPPVLLGDERKGGLFYVSPRSNFKAEVDNSELSGRGWVLQERFLSPRTLHFTQESIFFEDASGVKSEEDSLTGDTLLMEDQMALGRIEDERNPVWNFAVLHTLFDEQPVGNLGTMTAFKISYIPRSGNPRDLLTRWLDIVERYCKADLTFEKDKLPAISGLARYIRNHTGDQYFSGIWKSQFYLGLIWAPDSQGVKRSMTSRAPSWSWASVDGPIQYPQFNRNIARQSHLVHIKSHGDAFYASSASVILRTGLKRIRHIQPVATVRDNVYKPIPNAYQIMEMSPYSDILFPNTEHEESVPLPGPKPVGWFAIDDNNTRDHLGDTYCARIASFLSSVDIVLVLCPTGKDQHEYRRVGLGIIGGLPPGAFWKGVESTTFTIV